MLSVGMELKKRKLYAYSVFFSSSYIANCAFYEKEEGRKERKIFPDLVCMLAKRREWKIVF